VVDIPKVVKSRIVQRIKVYRTQIELNGLNILTIITVSVPKIVKVATSIFPHS
jgi:hypothetical protein